MTTLPTSPGRLSAGIVVAEPNTARVQRIIVLQHTPAQLVRTVVPQWRADPDDPTDEKRPNFEGPPRETIRIEAIIDTGDQVEDSTIAKFGIHPQLAELETLVYPSSRQLDEREQQIAAGVNDISSLEAPLTVFVWGRSRIAPVRLTEVLIQEELFDPNLNPIRATVSITMRVLSTDDVEHSDGGGRLFMAYLKNKESLAVRGSTGTLGVLGIDGLPI